MGFGGCEYPQKFGLLEGMEMCEEAQVDSTPCGNDPGWDNMDPSTVSPSHGWSWQNPSEQAGILEWAGMEGTYKGHLVQPLFDEQGNLHEDLAAFPSPCKHWGCVPVGNLSKSWFSNLWGRTKVAQGSFPIPCSHFVCRHCLCPCWDGTTIILDHLWIQLQLLNPSSGSE